MAKLSESAKAEIVRREMKGYRLARTASSSRNADILNIETTHLDSVVDDSEEQTPDLATLRRMYLGDEDAEDTESTSVDEATAHDSFTAHESAAASIASYDANNPAGEADELEDEIDVVEPAGDIDPWSRGARPKAVVFSGKKKTIIGSQG